MRGSNHRARLPRNKGEKAEIPKHVARYWRYPTVAFESSMLLSRCEQDDESTGAQVIHCLGGSKCLGGYAGKGHRERESRE